MRLDCIDDAEMSARQRELAERISARRGAVRGPYRVWLRSPELCDRVEALGAFARFESSLPEDLRLMTLLLASRAADAEYSWNAHVGQALAAGIPATVIDAIARRRAPEFDDDAHAAFFAFCSELLLDHFVSDATFARARTLFSSEQLVDAIGSLGNFTILSFCLTAFEVDLPPDAPSPFPGVRGYAHVAPPLSG